MNRSTEEHAVDSTGKEKTEEPVEFEFDTRELRELDTPKKKPTSLRALNGVSPQSQSIDPAANLELSQTLDDLHNLSWPLCKPQK